MDAETPPDSPAKSIAEDIESAARGLQHIAARVEALGLEPSERAIVRQVLQGLLDYRNGTAQMVYVDTAIAALTPIAERKP